MTANGAKSKPIVRQRGRPWPRASGRPYIASARSWRGFQASAASRVPRGQSGAFRLC
jgi:hypothetical protein